MLFSSSIFLFLFLPCVLLGYYVLFRKRRTLQNVFLFAASVFFYAWGEPKFVLIMLVSIAANYGFGLLVNDNRDRRRFSRTVVVIMLAFNISLLFVFKYLVFAVNNLNRFWGAGLPVPDIVLPIGISFFTFHAISYVLDVYWGRGEAQRNPLNVGLYIAFFPQLIAGPIIQYETIADQLTHRKESWADFSAGACRFIIGLGKKMLLANTLALIADKAFSLGGDNLSVSFAWMGALAYTFQIFFDFSGYSDMAIGLGKMFGFHFPENFNYPYISRSASEFWRRWHISLSTWFRNYVYIPLGGSRVRSKARLVFNLFVVWFLTGFWHGANWTFLCWGLLWFVFIAAEKLSGFEKASRWPEWLRHGYAMLLAVCGWVLFRADTIGDAGRYFRAMFGAAGNALWDSNAFLYLHENIWYLFFAVLFSLPVAPWLAKRLKGRSPVWGALCGAGLLALFSVSVSFVIKGSYNPFIYFNF